MKAIYRYEVPVDDAWHTIKTYGGIVHVACRTEAVVEFWAHVGGISSWRTFRVFGTGQPLPEPDAHTRPVHVGTALTPDGHLVWHLFELIRVGGGAHPGVLDPSRVEGGEQSEVKP